MNSKREEHFLCLFNGADNIEEEKEEEEEQEEEEEEEEGGRENAAGAVRIALMIPFQCNDFPLRFVLLKSQ